MLPAQNNWKTSILSWAYKREKIYKVKILCEEMVMYENIKNFWWHYKKIFEFLVKALEYYEGILYILKGFMTSQEFEK
jgi:hypothetical protein